MMYVTFKAILDYIAIVRTYILNNLYQGEI